MAWPSEEVRQVQEELRRRHLYYGDIDGQASQQMASALRRYQERKGFPVTGECDATTLHSLQLVPAPPEIADPLPDVPVLKSDPAPEIAEADRTYLEQIDAAESPPEAEPVGEAPLSTRVEEFVRQYLDVCETNVVADELAFYAPKMRYFDHGTVDLAFVKRDVAAYYKRWPERTYELLELRVLASGPEEVVVRFSISFNVRNASHSAVGRTENTFKLRTQGSSWKFTALRERRLAPGARSP